MSAMTLGVCKGRPGCRSGCGALSALRWWQSWEMAAGRLAAARWPHQSTHKPVHQLQHVCTPCLQSSGSQACSDMILDIVSVYVLAMPHGHALRVKPVQSQCLRPKRTAACPGTAFDSQVQPACSRLPSKNNECRAQHGKRHLTYSKTYLPHSGHAAVVRPAQKERLFTHA